MRVLSTPAGGDGSLWVIGTSSEQPEAWKDDLPCGMQMVKMSLRFAPFMFPLIP